MQTFEDILDDLADSISKASKSVARRAQAVREEGERTRAYIANAGRPEGRKFRLSDPGGLVPAPTVETQKVIVAKG